jgi:YaiO family outer membrane protein
MKKKLGVIISTMIMTQIIHASVDEQSIKAGYEYKSYTQDRGDLNLGFIEYKLKKSNLTAITKVTSAERDYGSNISHTGTKGDIDLYYKWNSLISTKTGIAISDKTPTFLHQEYRQEFYINPIKNLTLNFGGKHTKYENDINVNSYSTGFSYHLNKVIFSYKYNNYHSSEKGNSHGNIISTKLKDKNGLGSSQIWFGFGTGAYQYEWEPSNSKMTGDFRSVALRREQPINKNWTVSATLSQVWYKPPMMEKYNSTSGMIDLKYRW